MLETLTIENCFAHKNSTFDFNSGLTAITGPNYSGKSQILEMIRFALFGVSALRTGATDYKGARVRLTFKVRDTSYVVERTTSNAKLFRGTEPIAVGVRPVNLKIVDIFGYGLDVFDTANVATQGMIEALSAMRPADRKRLVDSTIGLNILDDIAKWCSDEALGRGREIAGMESTLVAPVAPQPPPQMRPLSDLLAERQTLSEGVLRAQGLRQRLATKPYVPIEPTCIEPRTVAEMEGFATTALSLRKQSDALRARIQKLPPDTPYTAEQLDQFEHDLAQRDAWDAAQVFLSHNPEPGWTKEKLDAEEKLHADHKAWSKWHSLMDEGSHVCPRCEFTWPIHEDEMVALGDWGMKSEPRRTVNYDHVVEGRKKLARFEAMLPERAAHELVIKALVTAPPKPPLASMLGIQQYRVALEFQVLRRELTDEGIELEAKLASIPEVREALITRRKYDVALEAHQKGVEAHAEWEAAVPAWKDELATLGDVEAKLEAVMELQVQVQTYERLLGQFNEAKTRFEAATERVSVLREEQDQYTRGKAALAEIKSRIKTYLVPSLSRVASHILTQMTRGALTEVEVDEDFDVRVGGIPIDGLSGAGKAAANLALRIGLGQVLTNRVFSVFMADEIDAAMDQDKAEATAECLRNLTDNIGQIILVSHKRPDADHYVQL